MEPTHQVFISYSNLNAVIANQICEQLESKSVKCWIAPRDIQPGSNWAGSIMKAIKTSKVLLLILTKDSNESEQVMREVERAVNLRLRIICLRLENIDLSDHLEYFISAVQGIAAFNKPLEKVLEDLYQNIKPLLPANSAPAATAGQATAEAKPKEDDAKRFQEAYQAHQDKDYYRAFALYSILVEQGIAVAQNNLGVMYDNGEGVGQDKRQAVHWYRKAAEQGYAQGQYNLGLMYHKGHGVEQDNGQALHWYQKAAEQGYVKAQYSLGLMYATGEGVSQDKGQAVLLYLKAAEQGYAKAQYKLGLMYDNGEGTSQDKGQAVYWYLKAAEQGDANAQCNLGWMYSKGEGVLQNKHQAVHWYRKAAEQGNAIAQFNLALKYEKGRGVGQDKQQAVHWYRKAAEQGNVEAKNKLENLSKNS